MSGGHRQRRVVHERARGHRGPWSHPPRRGRGPRPRCGAWLLPGHPGPAAGAGPARPRRRGADRVPARRRIRRSSWSSRPTTRRAWRGSWRHAGRGSTTSASRCPTWLRRSTSSRTRASSSSTGCPARALTARSRSSIPGARTACWSSWSRRQAVPRGRPSARSLEVPRDRTRSSPGRLGRTARDDRRPDRHRARAPR